MDAAQAMSAHSAAMDDGLTPVRHEQKRRYQNWDR